MADLETLFTRCKPLQDFYAIKRIPAETRSAGGIYIPGDVAEKYRPHEGIVLAIGPGDVDTKTGLRKPLPDVKVGDHVVFTQYSGSEAALQDKDYVMVRSHELLAVVEP
jgi:chaperonin GroES